MADGTEVWTQYLVGACRTTYPLSHGGYKFFSDYSNNPTIIGVARWGAIGQLPSLLKFIAQCWKLVKATSKILDCGIHPVLCEPRQYPGRGVRAFFGRHFGFLRKVSCNRIPGFDIWLTIRTEEKIIAQLEFELPTAAQSSNKFQDKLPSVQKILATPLPTITRSWAKALSWKSKIPFIAVSHFLHKFWKSLHPLILSGRMLLFANILSVIATNFWPTHERHHFR
jgi:hypothetical protein